MDFPNGLLSEKELKPYAPFQTDSYCGNGNWGTSGESALFNLILVEDAETLPSEVQVAVNFENENGRIAVCTDEEGDLVFYLYTVAGRECGRIHISKDFRVAEAWISGEISERCYALDTTLMLLYSFASSTRDTLLLHASAVEYEARGYLFLGRSGTGKSTHSRLWIEHAEGSELLNDDNPVLRIIDGRVYVYGSPWSGKTPCYRNRVLPVGGIVRLHQAPFNKIIPLSGAKGYAALQASCSYMKWDKDMAGDVHDTLSRIIEKTHVYRFECMPNREAVVICKGTVL